jgi:hypothetical protein
MNIRLCESRNELTVPESILSAPGLQSHNPQFTPFSAFSTTVPVRIFPAFFDTANRNRKTILGSPAKPLGMFDDSFVLTFRKRRVSKRLEFIQQVQMNSKKDKFINPCYR